MESQVPNPIVPSTTPSIKPSNHLAIIAMALFILLCLGSVIFLFYQNQQLKKMLTQYQIQNLPTPTPTATIDPTSDWKTYTNEKYGYSFKYPDYFLINETNQQKVSFKDMSKKYAVMSGDSDYINVFGIDYVKNFDSVCFDGCVKNQPITFGENIFTPYTDNGLHEVNNYFTKNNYSIWTTFSYNDPLIDQILSTFKFLDDNQQTACTMEAKICPDGSSVGRTGPNCEFSPCP